MKRETIIGITMLMMFVAFVTLGGEIASTIVYMIGCFAVGWNIPDAAEAISKRLFGKGE